MMKKQFARLAVIIALGIPSFCLAQEARLPKASITIKGSDTLVILAQKWAETYMAGHPNVKIQVTGGGSGNGFAALQNNETDIADASRQIKPDEKANCIRAFNKVPKEYKVAVDGLSIYVNSKNPIKELDLAQLKKIFTGEIVNWKELGGSDASIIVYSRENSSGTYEYFKEHVLEKKDFTAKAQTMQGTAALLQAIVNEPNGIGYGGAAFGMENVRTLGVKKDAATPAVEPTEATVLNETYPIWRYLYNYVNPAIDKGAVHDYLEWIRSDEGQKIVKEIGYYPLPANLRSQK